MSDFDAGNCTECGDNCSRFNPMCDKCWDLKNLKESIAKAEIWNSAISEAAQLVHRTENRELAWKIRELKKNGKDVAKDFL